VTEVQHRITKTGKNFGSFAIEDFTGKTDFILWSEDYVKFQNYLEVGQKVCINGSFRNRFNQPNNFEFKLQNDVSFRNSEANANPNCGIEFTSSEPKGRYD
jgi:DNA polymerase III subunit alpha